MRGRREIYGRAGAHALLGVTPVLITALLAWAYIRGHVFAFDFHHAYWTAAKQVLAGASPYASPHAAAASNDTAFVYPALAAILLAPFGLLGHALGDGLFTALVLAAVLAALRALDVRDWRLYGLVLLWPPVIAAWQNANVTLLLVLGVACVWRWRERPLIAGVLAAVLISVKVFVWPIGLWLLATRRLAAFAYAVAVGLALNLAAWAILGHGEISRYLQLLSAVTRIEQRDSYSIVALVLHLGGSQALAYAIVAALVVLAGSACILAGRRGEEVRAMVLCIAVTLLATPILWTHYLALLIVPLALARPRLSAVWLLPMAMLLAPLNAPPGMSERVLGIAVGAGVLCLLWWDRSALGARPPAPRWTRSIVTQADC